MTTPQLPRVVIDGRMVSEVPHGFARYVKAIAAGLARVRMESSLAYEPVFLRSSRISPEAFEGFPTVETGARFLSPLEMLEIPILLRRLGASLYHSPTFSSLRGAPCPWMLTVHDLNHLKYGGWREKFYYERLLKPFVKKANALVTVSEFSRKEIAEWSGLRLEAIDVVQNAIDPCFLERPDSARVDEALAARGLFRRRYFFCLSNSKPHKNLALLVRAFATYRSRAPKGWDLVLNLREGELDLPAVPGLNLIGRPSDDEARSLMAGAGAVAFPSEYEGFGLPPVEAACLSVPLLVSRIPPHREALADLFQGEVLWLDPKDVEAWANGMSRATLGHVLPASIESRAALMRRYSAATVGAHMDRIYRRVLKIES